MQYTSLSSYQAGLNAFSQTAPLTPTIPITIQKEQGTEPTAMTVGLTLLGTIAGLAAGAAIQYFIFCQALKRCG